MSPSSPTATQERARPAEVVLACEPISRIGFPQKQVGAELRAFCVFSVSCMWRGMLEAYLPDIIALSPRPGVPKTPSPVAPWEP